MWADATAAALALGTGVSWLVAARRSRPFAARHSAAVALWGLLVTGVHLLRAVDGAVDEGWLTALFLGSAVVGGVGVAGMVRDVRVRGSLAAPTAEAVLLGSSGVAVVWSLAGPRSLSGSGLVVLASVVVGASIVAYVVRMPVSSRDLVLDGSVLRTAWVGGAGVLVIVVGTALLVLPSPAQVVSPLVTALGYLCVAVAPWVGAAPYGEVSRRGGRLSSLPAGLVVLALLALGLRVAAVGFGPAERLLALVVVASLVGALVLALRDNHALLEDLGASRQRLAALVENTSDVIVRLDADGTVMSANAATSRLLNRSPAAVVGLPVWDLAALRDRERLRDDVLAVCRGWTADAQAELDLSPPATGTAELRLSALPDGAVGNLHDVTDAVRLRGRLERMARFDQMTGLANRSHLVDVVGGWLTAYEADPVGAGPVAVLYCDLDGFKAVNDRFGHTAGDMVLTEVARRLRVALAAVQSCELLAGRIGGDEFVVAARLPAGSTGGGEAAHAERLVDRLADLVVGAVRQPVDVGDRTVSLGMSVGVAGCGQPPPCGAGLDGAAELFHRADLAMYAAKQTGRNRVRRWAPDLDSAAQRRVDIEIGLRRALDTRGLELAYQPVVRLADGVVTTMEALVRVPASDRSPGGLGGIDDVVSPAELVAVAEDIGAITEMGAWVLTQATRQAAHWRRLGHDIRIAVNMSVRQLAAENFAQTVARALEEAGLPPERLILEITENQLVGQTGPAQDTLASLQRLGVVLAIDDFGTGYSSLAYLRRLPVQILKIDKMLLDGIASDPKAVTLVRAVVSMARSLGLLVVAEGIEDLRTARRVRDLGAWAGQGYALSRAVGAQEMTAILDGPPPDLDADRAAPAPATAPAAPAGVAPHRLDLTPRPEPTGVGSVSGPETVPPTD